MINQIQIIREEREIFLSSTFVGITCSPIPCAQAGVREACDQNKLPNKRKHLMPRNSF